MDVVFFSLGGSLLCGEMRVDIISLFTFGSLHIPQEFLIERKRLTGGFMLVVYYSL